MASIRIVVASLTSNSNSTTLLTCIGIRSVIALIQTLMMRRFASSIAFLGEVVVVVAAVVAGI